MFDNSTDHASAPLGAPTSDVPTPQRSLLGAEPTIDDWPLPMAGRRPDPVMPSESVFDRIGPRSFGIVAVGLLSGLLLGVVALTLLRGGDDTSTAAGPEITMSVDPAAGSQDPSVSAPVGGLGSVPDGEPSSPSPAAPELSTTSAPTASSSTTAPATAETVATTAMTAATTTAPATTGPPSTETGQTTSTAGPSTDSASTDSTMATTTAPATEPSTSSTAAPTTATTRPVASGDDAAMQQQVLTATNAERAAAGCPPLRLDPTLSGAADAHSEDMAARAYFDHNDPEGRGPGDRINASGYPHRGWGENIAAGYGSAAAVVEGWMNSSGHRANILNCSYDELGVGYAEPGRYWTQLFATRR